MSYVFQDKDNMFTFAVKEDFLSTCPNPETKITYELLSKYKMFNFFHNEDGPAIIRHKDNREEYWLNGKSMHTDDPSGTAIEKIKFNQKLKKSL